MKYILTFLIFCCLQLQLIAQVITETKDLSFCDSDGDGFVSIPFSELQNYALDVLADFNESPEVYVTKAHKGIEKITHLYNNPQIVNICGDTDGEGGYYDIAIDNQSQIYIVRKYGYLQKVNLQNCTYQPIGQIHSNGQSVLALSFDHLNNLYEGGWTSKVYRAEAGNLTQFNLWHDFGIGNPSGDFVQIGDFMYIAWTMPDGKDHLLKVTLGANNEYVSHVDLGKIRTGTFGLAAEYGRLYGNTVDELYEINLQNMDLTTIKFRPNPQNSAENWWGASGLHEALHIEISYHATQEDATTGNSPLSDPFTNPIPFQQSFVYIRVHESTQNTTYIIPIRISITIPPAAYDANLTECRDPETGLATFELDVAESSINPNPNLQFTYYNNLDDLNNNQNPLLNTLAISSTQIVFVKVVDTDQNCYGIAELELKVPTVDVQYEDHVAFCKGTSVVLSVPDIFISYQWSGLQGEDMNQNLNSNEISVQFPGEYLLTVTDQNNCSYQLPFTVVNGGSPVITDVIINSNNSITVKVSPSGIYEYSLDNVFWQSSPTFYNLKVDDYLIYVRDLVGCYSDAYKFSYFLIPNFISPNGDGFNDNWEIRGLEQYENVKVQIFDRYGKLFFDRKINAQNFVWDGFYMGRPVASGTYWYLIQIGEEKKFSGFLNVRNSTFGEN